MNKYSIIVCYRNRETHLKINIPRLHQHFTNLKVDFEIIVVEQNDNDPFCRGQLFNEGAKIATGNILIFHDIDHYPTSDTNYTDFNTDVFLPIKKVVYVYNDLTPKPEEFVPRGYRHFKYSVDDDFFGGISIFTKESFFRINGFSNVYVGWGLEDADLRERVKLYGLSVSRSETNQFLALDHPDSGAAVDDKNFVNNNMAFAARNQLLKYGVNSQLADTELVDPHMKEITTWLKATNFAVNEELV